MESASDEIKAQVAEFEQLEATEAEKAMQKWDMEIQDSRNVNCQALRGNMAFSEISIDKETLVDRHDINAQLEQRFPNFFFCTVPGTMGEQTLMLPKNQVFAVNDEDKARYVAFVNNQKPAKLWVKVSRMAELHTRPEKSCLKNSISTATMLNLQETYRRHLKLLQCQKLLR